MTDTLQMHAQRPRHEFAQVMHQQPMHPNQMYQHRPMNYGHRPHHPMQPAQQGD